MGQQQFHHLGIAAISGAEKRSRAFLFEPDYMAGYMHFGFIRQPWGSVPLPDPE